MPFLAFEKNMVQILIKSRQNYSSIWLGIPPCYKIYVSDYVILSEGQAACCQGSLYTAVDLLFEWQHLNTYTMDAFGDFCRKTGATFVSLMANILIKFLNFWPLKFKRLRSKHHQYEKFLKLKEILYSRAEFQA